MWLSASVTCKISPTGGRALNLLMAQSSGCACPASDVPLVVLLICYGVISKKSN